MSTYLEKQIGLIAHLGEHDALRAKKAKPISISTSEMGFI
jgi:hypothetical protein